MLGNTAAATRRGPAPLALAVGLALGAWTAACAHTPEPPPIGTLTFEWLPELPDDHGFGGPIVGVHEEALIVAGGANFPVALTEGGKKVWHDRIFALLPGADGWIDAGRLPQVRAYAACASTSLGVVAVGGSDADQVYAETWLLTWDRGAQRVHCRALPPFPAPCVFGAAEAIGDRVWVLGGSSSPKDHDVTDALWTIDVSAPDPVWEARTALPGAARFKVVTAVQRGPKGEPCLYACSGSAGVVAEDQRLGYALFTDAYRYTPSTDRWERLADLPALKDPRGLDPEGRYDRRPWPINAGVGHAYGQNGLLTLSGSTGRYIFDDQGQIRPPGERPFFAPRVLHYDAAQDHWHEAGTMPEGVVTTRAVAWNGFLVVPSGEVKPGIRTPRVQALRLAPTAGQAPPGGAH